MGILFFFVQRTETLLTSNAPTCAHYKISDMMSDGLDRRFKERDTPNGFRFQVVQKHAGCVSRQGNLPSDCSDSEEEIPIMKGLGVDFWVEGAMVFELLIVRGAVGQGKLKVLVSD